MSTASAMRSYGGHDPRCVVPILLAVGLLGLGCGKASDRGPASQQAGGGERNAPGVQGDKGQATAAAPAQSSTPTVEIVTELDTEYAAEVSRSTSGDFVATPWSKSVRPWTWSQPMVIIGRSMVFAAGKPVAKVLCSAEQPALCEPAALRGPTGKQALELDPAQLDASQQLVPLAAAVAENAWKDKEVLVTADRRVAWAALDRVMTTLSAAGARPVLVAATYAGQLARVMPAPGTVATAPAVARLVPAESAAPGETHPVPDDLAGVTVGVTAHGMSLTLLRKAGEPRQPELLGNVLEALAAWAERLRAAAPSLVTATVSIEPQAPVEEVVRAIDALRDTCARAAKGTPCLDRRVVYPHIELISSGVAPATPKPTPGDAPAVEPIGQIEPTLLLVPPTLQAAQPPSGGLFLRGGALDRDVQLRNVPANLASPIRFRPAGRLDDSKPGRP